MIEYINNNITSTQQAHKDKAKAEEENLKILKADLEMDRRYERTVEDRKNYYAEINNKREERK